MQVLFDLAVLPSNQQRKQVLLDSAYYYGIKAIRLYPQYQAAYKNLGVVKVTMGDMDSAAFYWTKAVRLAPNDKVVLGYLENAAAQFYNEGMKFYNEGNNEMAFARFMKSHEAKPNDHRPMYFLGLLYQKNNDKIKAKEIWTQALSFAPGDQILLQALQSLGTN